MTTIRLRHTHLIALVASALLSIQVHAQQQMVEIDIASQSLSEALRELGTASNTNILFEPAMVKGVVAPALKGSITREEALTRLLAGTKWSFKFVDENTVSLVPGDSKAAAAPASSHASPGFQSPSPTVGEGNGEKWRLAQSEHSNKPDSGETAASSSDEYASSKIQEIVVSAQKRGDERLQDVPIPVSVLSATSLLQNGGTGLRDYFTKVPGVSLVTTVGGASSVVIRGVATNGVNDNPTVGVMIDDAPYGSSTALGGGLMPIDMDPNELSQIEVLRGPQGTLYGASSLGGLLRYITLDPSLDGISGRLSMSGQSVRNSDGIDYSVRGSLNFPINSSLALRVSGFDREEAGYIDDTFSGKEGINSGHSYGGRAALLWRVNEDWSAKLSAVRQLLRTDGTDVVDINPSEEERLESSDYVPNGQGADRALTFLTGSVEGKISDIDLTSISAYTSSNSTMREGFTRGRLFPFVQLALPGADAGLYSATQSVEKFSQELRASIPISDSIDWLVGAFYTKEKGSFPEVISTGRRATGEILTLNGVLGQVYSTNYTEIAAFTNLAVRFTDRFDVQFGGRLSENSLELTQTLLPSFLSGGQASQNGPRKVTDDPFTYLITPRFKVTDHWMVYSRIASGYRPGGPTFGSISPGVLASLKADTTKNYEVGIKGELFDRRVTIDTSAYYIEWKDIPITIRPPNALFIYQVNAAGAISKGFELSFDVRPLQGLHLSAWGAWGDAYIDELPSVTTVAFRVGDPLPYSARFSGSASIDYERPISASMSGNIGASMRYVGDRSLKVVNIAYPSNVLPAYTQVDAHVGLIFGEWTVNAFVNNVTDERGRIGVRGLGDFPPNAVNIIRPRTIGLSLSKDF